MSINFSGFILPAATLGLGALLIRPRRGFLPSGDSALIVPQATIEETHRDELAITQHPVEQGAAIADHAYKRPAKFTVRAGWSNSPTPQGGLVAAAIAGITPFARIPFAAQRGIALANTARAFLSGNAEGQIRAIYAQLLELQASREPFTVYTGKRTYVDVLFESLETRTDLETENSLIIEAHCYQVIIVNTQVVQVLINVDAQSAPESTTPEEDMGSEQVGDEETYVEPEEESDEVIDDEPVGVEV